MGPRDTTSGSLRAPLGAALDEEVRRLDRLIARLWQALSGLCVIGGIGVAVLVPAPLGAWAALAFGVLFVWFGVLAELLERRSAGPWLTVVATIVESSLPWIFLLVATWTQGPAYAVGSWLPPMLFGGLMVAWTARLRPFAPIVVGVSGALFYLAIYFGTIVATLPVELRDAPLYQPSIQLTRALTLVVGGAVAALVARGLRSAIGKAERTVRQQDLFGKYRIVRRIASGGMGSVYEALYCPEGGFERRVAIKLIHEHLARQASFVDAFRNEAELSARLLHPNVVQVLDFGRTGDSYFLAMEYVEGMTLDALQSRLREANVAVSPRVAAWIGQELLSGLAYAHAGARDASGNLLRVIHRDIAPANILCSTSGEVKLSDFGVARALRDASAADTKSVAGHVGYMAPEQARGSPLDERCDLFGIGIILWEMLAGRPLFYRGSDGPSLLALLEHEIPPLAGERSLVPAWDAALARALAKDPDDRFATAAEMGEAIKQLEREHPGDARAELAALVARTFAAPIGDDAAARSSAPSREEPVTLVVGRV